jgi:serine/threonine protein kinase
VLATGTTIAGLRIDGLLGHGGMGIVYRATQLSLQRVVALKLVSPELSRDPGFRARFRREGVIQGALDHPNIVPEYEAGDSEDGLYIAMRLVPGSSLKQLILAQELDAMRTLQVLAGAASGLDAAHAAGLIHRDIKPHNILVVGNQGYLADFGLSKARGLESITKESGWIGTLDYMAPEQIRGDRPDASSDLYSLGAVLYECLVGWVPFPRSSEIAVMYAHLESPPPSVRDTRPELPVQLDDVVARAMAKKPESRQATATELIREATEALGGLAHAAELPPPPPRPARAREESSATGQTTAPPSRRPPVAAPALRRGGRRHDRGSRRDRLVAGRVGDGRDLHLRERPGQALQA